MQMYKDSLSVFVLDYLNRSGLIPRKNLATPFSSYNYSYYARVVRQLMEIGYIEVVRYKGVAHVRITEKGQNELAEVLGSRTIVKEQAASDDSQKKVARQRLMVDVFGLCEASAILVREEEKPSLVSLFSSSPLPEEEKALLDDAIETGVFYTTGEIRRAYMEIVGKNEISNWTRLCGVLIHESNISFVYSIARTLIKFSVGGEDRSVKNIMNFLMMCPAFREIEIKNGNIAPSPNGNLNGNLSKNYNNGNLTCIICGRGYPMIPKLVYGRKNGQLSEDKTIERFRSKQSKEHINTHNLAKIFKYAHYVTVDKRGAIEFKVAKVLSEEAKERLSKTWYDNTPDIVRLKTLGYRQGMNSNRERVIHLPYIDLLELDFYKSQGEPCHMVVPKGTQESISRVMGTLLLSIKDVNGNPLKCNRYDNDGKKLEKEDKT